MPTFDVADAVTQSFFVDAVYRAFARDKQNLAPAVELPDGYELIAWIRMTDTFVVTLPQFYGIIAADRTRPGDYVLAYRGAETPLEWIDGAWAALVPFVTGYVHAGFRAIYQTIDVVEATAPRRATGPSRSFAEQVADAIGRSSPAALTPARRLRLVGHSLGAALLTLFIVDNAATACTQIPVVYTYGSPRVGDAAFVAAYDALRLPSWRIDNLTDIVPDIPPEAFGYAHVAAVINIDSSGYVRYSPACVHQLPAYRAALMRTPLDAGPCAPAADTPA